AALKREDQQFEEQDAQEDSPKEQVAPSNENIFNYQQTKNKIIHLLTIHIHVQLRSLIKNKEPWEAIELLQDRFRSSEAAKIVELKSKLETLQPINKKNVHPYDQTL